MRYGLPGMTPERFALLTKERARAAGEDVTFTADEIEMLHEEARHANETLSAEVLVELYGPDEPDPDIDPHPEAA